MKCIEVTPPIEVNVRVESGSSGARVLKALKASHDYPDGVPLDAEVTPEHRAATRRLMASREITLSVVSVYEDGDIGLAFAQDVNAHIARARVEFGTWNDRSCAFDEAIYEGINNERGMRLVLAALGVHRSSHMWKRIMGHEPGGAADGRG